MICRYQEMTKNYETAEAFQYLDNLRKKDPNKSEQRKRLVKEITALNDKFNLGLKLDT